MECSFKLYDVGADVLRLFPNTNIIPRKIQVNGLILRINAVNAKFQSFYNSGATKESENADDIFDMSWKVYCNGELIESQLIALMKDINNCKEQFQKKENSKNKLQTVFGKISFKKKKATPLNKSDNIIVISPQQGQLDELSDAYNALSKNMYGLITRKEFLREQMLVANKKVDSFFKNTYLNCGKNENTTNAAQMDFFFASLSVHFEEKQEITKRFIEKIARFAFPAKERSEKAALLFDALAGILRKSMFDYLLNVKRIDMSDLVNKEISIESIESKIDLTDEEIVVSDKNFMDLIPEEINIKEDKINLAGNSLLEDNLSADWNSFFTNLFKKDNIDILDKLIDRKMRNQDKKTLQALFDPLFGLINDSVDEHKFTQILAKIGVVDPEFFKLFESVADSVMRLPPLQAIFDIFGGFLKKQLEKNLTGNNVGSVLNNFKEEKLNILKPNVLHLLTRPDLNLEDHADVFNAHSDQASLDFWSNTNVFTQISIAVFLAFLERFAQNDQALNIYNFVKFILDSRTAFFNNMVERRHDKNDVKNKELFEMHAAQRQQTLILFVELLPSLVEAIHEERTGLGRTILRSLHYLLLEMKNKTHENVLSALSTVVFGAMEKAMNDIYGPNKENSNDKNR